MYEEEIWGFLAARLPPVAAAGVMGNLYAESGLNPMNLQGTYEKKLGMSDAAYTAAVDSGDYTNFAKDAAGYGLAQWTHSSRKAALLQYARQAGRSVGDLETQRGFLWEEMRGYGGLTDALMRAGSVREASDAVLTRYERPADQGPDVREKRAAYGQRFYEQFRGDAGVPAKDEGGENMAINFDKYLYSTGTHYIANSGSDENKAYTGGKAGDQTGREAELKKWYNRPWTVVLRYGDQAVALSIAKLGIAMCLNDQVGYDQGQRTTYWKQLQAAGYDPSKITAACEADCTAGVSANVRAAGYLHGIKALQDQPICSSRNMRAQFTKAGFSALTDSKYLTGTQYLLPGDILLYESHHAATNVTLGRSVTGQWNPAAASEPAQAEAAAADAAGEGPCVSILGSANIRKGPSTAYDAMGVARAGDRLKYFGFAHPDSGWLLVEYAGATGWVSNKYGEVCRDVG